MENNGASTRDANAIASKENLSSPDISPLQNRNMSEIQMETEGKESCADKCRNFTINVGKYKINFFKPLLPLKVALFLWVGGASVIPQYFPVYIKQKGFSMSEIILFYLATIPGQTLVPTMIGIATDKFGRSKFLLLLILLVSVLIPFCLIFSPTFKENTCDTTLHLFCYKHEFKILVRRTKCSIVGKITNVSSCNASCPETNTSVEIKPDFISKILESVRNDTWSFAVHKNTSRQAEDGLCLHDIHQVRSNVSYFWCNAEISMPCEVTCDVEDEEECSPRNGHQYFLFVVNFIFWLLFHGLLTSTHRILDATAVSLVKEHNTSSYGRIRFWGVLSGSFNPALCGYLVHATTQIGMEVNYTTALYYFASLCFLALIVSLNVNIRVKEPGKKMWKKSLTLLHNSEILATTVVLTVLGSTWGFQSVFRNIYLEQFGIPNYFIGLRSGIIRLCGLPFLFTSNWWIAKIGTTNVISLALLGYTVKLIGYSLIPSAWGILIIEVIIAPSYYLLWVAIVEYCEEISPDDLKYTVIAVAGGLHYSIGKGLGTLFGGMIMKIYGGKIAHAVVGITCFVTAIFYSTFLCGRRHYFRKKQKMETRS